ncbi:MAG: hypothetical protein V3W41_09805 [Planctomycetota bacterium]
MTQNGRTTRSTTPVVFFLSLLVLAVVIHLGQAMPAEKKLAAKSHQLEDLQRHIATEREISETLSVRRECLDHDIQTVEDELRTRGFGRPGDRVFHPVNFPASPK